MASGQKDFLLSLIRDGKEMTFGQQLKLTMLLAVPAKEAEKALQVLKKNRYGRAAAVVGEVAEGKGVYLHTALGSFRKILPLRGEGLPRIC